MVTDLKPSSEINDKTITSGGRAIIETVQINDLNVGYFVAPNTMQFFGIGLLPKSANRDSA